MNENNKDNTTNKLLIGRPLYRGFSLCYPVDTKGYDKKILIKSAIEGEVVRAKIIDNKKDYSTADLINVINHSQYRTTPACYYYNNCGGCHYQHIKYDKQVQIKEDILKDCLKRIAKISIQPSNPITGIQWHYRYRGNFKLKSGKVGFYKEGSRDLVEIKRCLLMNESINEALNLIRGVLTNNDDGEITIMGSKGDALVCFKTRSPSEKVCDKLALKGIEIKTLTISNDNTTFENNHKINLGIDGIRYKVSPFSFFQANWNLNLEVIKLIKREVDFVNKVVCDIYCGGGNFTLAIADIASFVYGYEENHYAIQDAKDNAGLNGVKNCEFLCQKAEEINIREGIDIVIINPPRLGMSKKAMERLLQIRPKTIIYMSCDPSTLSRDLQRLSKFYLIKSIRLIDFFPHTYHIESLAILDSI